MAKPQHKGFAIIASYGICCDGANSPQATDRRDSRISPDFIVSGKTFMQFEFNMPQFYSSGDERRFFQGLKELPPVKEFHRHRGRLVIRVEPRFLGKVMLCELIALLWRYDISLEPFCSIAFSNKKFCWLNDAQCYWYASMFKWPGEHAAAL
jgi:hypothetical protein